MSTLREMPIGSEVELEVGIKGKKITFNTVIYDRIEKVNKKLGYGVKCGQIRSEDGRLLNFSRTSIIAKVKNKEDNRQYEYIITMCVHSNKENYLYLYSLQDVKPKNFRSNYRVPCGYRTNMQIGTNRKAIDGHVHDISFSGISLVYAKDKVKSDIGQKVSAMIYDDNDSERGYRISADIVRIEEEWNKDKTLIGAKFDDNFTVANKDISKIVIQCQRKELKLRKDNGSSQN